MEILILGSGLAGLTAAIYSARGGLDTTVIAGRQPGGQLMLTTYVENYPGFEEPILGPVLMEKTRKQAERLGVKFVDPDATKVDFSTRPFKISVDGEPYEGDAVIIATGASAKWLGLENEERLRGRGISSCATCDGFFFRGKEVAVVGGGDTAIEEALSLEKLVSRVTVIHRRDQLRAQKILQQRAFNSQKINFLWNHEVIDMLGGEKVEGVRVRNVQTGAEKELKYDGVFIAIGYKPNTEIFAGQVEIDERGYLIRKNHSMSSVEGVFIAGDAFDHVYRQAVTAAGSGCEAALDAIKWLDSQKATAYTSPL